MIEKLTGHRKTNSRGAIIYPPSSLEIYKKVNEIIDFLNSDSVVKVTEKDCCPAGSEDERIRKAICNCVKWFCFDSCFFKDVSQEECLAWLEKQAEHANFRNKIQIGDKVTRNEDGVLVNLSQLKRVAKKDEKQGEQKSFARYKVGDTIYYDSFGRLVSFVISNIVEDGTDNPMYEDKNGNSVFQNDIVEQKPVEEVEPKFKTGDKIISTISNIPYYITEVCNGHYLTDVGCIIMFNAQDNFELVEQKPAWSEEDEKILSTIIKEGDLKPSERQWLKSLKDRVQLKQEWSEEDDGMLYGVIETEQYMLDVVTGVKTFDVGNEQIESQCTKELAWLKILKDRCTWKPSDEQMNLLREVQQALLGRDCHNRFVNFMYELKRLREK